MSSRERRRRAAGLLLVALILVLCSSPQFRAYINFPDHVRLPVGGAQDFAFRLPIGATVRPDHGGALALNGVALGLSGQRVALGAPLSIQALDTGQYTVDFRLFGLIPLRRLKVDVVPPIKLVPGGHSIGVLLHSRGVIVVGHAAIRGEDGGLHQPGREAGLALGDAITQIGGVEISGEEQAARLFEEAGRVGGPVSVTIKRRGRMLTKWVTPLREKESGKWRAGIYIRDGAAGVGTLTFYDPASGRYGALGHVIADAETSQPIDVQDGHIVEAEISSIQPGRPAAPGEKDGRFKNEDNWLGTIERNTRFGIFGSMHAPVHNPYFPEPIPVGLGSQVKQGPAEILTVVDGQKLERYAVTITRLMRQPTAEGKNMIVKVTDARLLAKTGGIVQGMSGSPIVQDGRIIGAVTHVFVNDPTRGYGILIEWMLQDAGVFGPAAGMDSGRRSLPGLLPAPANVIAAGERARNGNERVTEAMLV